MLTLRNRDNELVKRGMQAVNMIFQLSNRVPGLIEHSQLERQEGKKIVYQIVFFNL